jgi:hypothetical protein
MVTARLSREIAETLSLSPRTVEHHIEAIFNRLGVGSRVELVTVLLKPGLPERARPAVPPLRPVDGREHKQLPDRLEATFAAELDDLRVASV